MSFRPSGRLLAASCFLTVALMALIAAVLAHGSDDPRVTVTVPSLVRQDGPIHVALRGEVKQPGDAWATIGRTCGGRDGQAIVPPTPVSGGFTLTADTTLDRPGGYRVCAWVRREGAPRLVGQAGLTIRAPQGSITLAAPAIVDQYGYFDTEVRGVSDDARAVSLIAVRDGTACDAVHPRWIEQEVLETAVVSGRFTRRMRHALDDFGRWTLCAVLSDGGKPLSIARRSITVEAL